MVNPVKTPSGGQPAASLEPGQLAKKKNHFMDFREIVRGGCKADTGTGGGPPVEPGSVLAETLGPGTPLAEGRQAPPPEVGPGRSARDDEDECVGVHAPLDPLEIALAAPLTAPRFAETDLTPRTDFAAAVLELVRRISWGGDRRSGTARIELGAGVLAGGSILVQAIGRQVQVEIELPAGLSGRELEERLRVRLAARGIDVQALTVR